MTNREDKLLTAAFIVAVILAALGSVAFGMYRLHRMEEFNKREHNGHTYIFYGDRPVEHDVECKKCLDRFD